MEYDGLFVHVFFPIPTILVCLWLRGFFPFQIPSAFFYLSKVLREAQGRGSQTLRKNRRGQIKIAFPHLGNSFVLEKTVYSQMCYSCHLFWFLSFLLCIDIQGTLKRWTFLFTGRYNKASFPTYVKQRHLEMRAMVQGGLLTLFPWQGSAYQTERSISHVVVICGKNCHRWC